MREIIFRGKRLDNGEWVFGMLGQYHDGIKATIIDNHFGVFENTVELVCVAPETVGQYTGLKDNNGKKIFEGDIIKADNGKQSSISVVKFGEYYPKLFFAMLDICCTGVQHLNANGFYAETTKHEDMILFKSRHLVVIGNVHDNPELIKEEDET